ncbi:diaminopimelate decarboxylase [Gynuella sunshinyii]|uniref:Diaminopimelate decarboxylase n=1 Tax=Gynuella sunshinyii YC6258 TaxID=1445510 RepID=A0A0C5VF05_9GAMM|nr:diaminopimelate decarboxylase [Gynuella sunshinyii]AJQ93142.1 diaminopimelate decarboxylase [Gynuella sunshinyii YC6258]
MNPFQYRDNELYIEELPLTEVAAQHGTPLYVYSRQAIETAWHGYADALKDHGMVCYAVKANSNIGVLNLLARLGSGFDIVSVGELERVLTAGGDPSKVVFSGVGKQVDEIRRALEVGIHCFNVESVAELQRINEVAGTMDMQAPVSIRVNPDVDAKTHPYISTGLKQNKFGIDINSAEQVYALAASLAHINVIGVDCHIGSQITDVTPFLDALDRLLALIDRLAGKGIQIRHLDLGGGVGVQYQQDEPVVSLTDYVQQIVSRLGARALTLIMEPGRSIVANAGVLLTRVEYLKQNDEHNFAIVDGAMNDLIRPSLYQAWQDVKPLQLRTGTSHTWDIVGPICETTDFLAKGRQLVIEQGDILAIMDSGAYGFTMASNYNSRPRVAEILVDGQQTHVVRRREIFADLIAHEYLIE